MTGSGLPRRRKAHYLKGVVGNGEPDNAAAWCENSVIVRNELLCENEVEVSESVDG